MGPGGGSYPSSFSVFGSEYKSSDLISGIGWAIKGGEGRGLDAAGTMDLRSWRRSSTYRYRCLHGPYLHNGIITQIFTYLAQIKSAHSKLP